MTLDREPLTDKEKAMRWLALKAISQIDHLIAVDAATTRARIHWGHHPKREWEQHCARTKALREQRGKLVEALETLSTLRVPPPFLAPTSQH